MSNDKDKILAGHEYDGITELDNPLPRWWVLTFLITIVFSFFYVLHYHTNTGLLIEDEYEADLSRIVNSKNAKPGLSDEVLAVALSDANQIGVGKVVYSSRCVACHAEGGAGSIGPNLTDQFWISGRGTPMDIANTIRVGVPEKGMPGWETMMSREELIAVSAYVVSLKGTKPPSPKAPQGTEVKE